MANNFTHSDKNWCDQNYNILYIFPFHSSLSMTLILLIPEFLLPKISQKWSTNSYSKTCQKMTK